MLAVSQTAQREQRLKAEGRTQVFVVQAQVVVQLRADLRHQGQILQLLQLVDADVRHPQQLNRADPEPEVHLLHCWRLLNKESRYWLSLELKE